jgi:uncharacterized membrane protein YheB (UPF0754 family)
MENWGIDSLSKSFENSNRLNLQYIEYPEWYTKTKNNYIMDIISENLQQNEKLKQERIDKVISVVKERIEVFENTIKKLK